MGDLAREILIRKSNRRAGVESVLGGGGGGCIVAHLPRDILRGVSPVPIMRHRVMCRADCPLGRHIELGSGEIPLLVGDVASLRGSDVRHVVGA